MTRCIRLAKNGVGYVSPNPLVGCVILKNGRIIGEGYHQKFGDAHAEVNAIRSAADDVAGSDLYVNLEPCSMFGKTPPCVDLIIEKRIARVHIAMLDPNPLVNGNGVRKLRDAGIEVEVGIQTEAARELNEVFIKFITTRMPFVVMKVAQSLDGKIALSNGASKYITSAESLKRVHEMRAQYDSVLVGAGTVAADDPRLTVRYSEGRSPVRILIDGNLSTSPDAHVFADRNAIVFFSRRIEKNKTVLGRLKKIQSKGVRTVGMSASKVNRTSLESILKRIGEMSIASVLVEGGTSVFSQFIKRGLVDKFHVFVAPKIIGEGKSMADEFALRSLDRALTLRLIELTRLGPDIMLTGYPD